MCHVLVNSLGVSPQLRRQQHAPPTAISRDDSVVGCYLLPAAETSIRNFVFPFCFLFDRKKYVLCINCAVKLKMEERLFGYHHNKMQHSKFLHIFLCGE
jgi:hypothetical protein